MDDIRIALVVQHCPLGEVEANLERMAAFVDAAAQQGADIICFPELNVTGYSTRNAAALNPQSIAGPVTQSLEVLAQQKSLVILAGLAEKDKENRLYASHLVVTPEGLCGAYRKVHISPPERVDFTAGSHIPLFTVRGVKFGIQLCYDTHFPELSTHMALNGADLIFMPHASPRTTPKEKLKSWMRHLSARAFDNSLFVAACNQSGYNGSDLNFAGVAVVIGPSGDIKEKKTDEGEGMLVVELKADELAHVRGHRMRYFFPNRRPELYKL
jgi:N-carbamoylputrescine amidase